MPESENPHDHEMMTASPLLNDPKARPRFSLADLIAQCDFDRPMTPEDRQWLDSPPVSGEAI